MDFNDTRNFYSVNLHVKKLVIVFIMIFLVGPALLYCNDITTNWFINYYHYYECILSSVDDTAV